MTTSEFTAWLEGFAEGVGLAPEHVAKIAQKAKQIGPPSPAYPAPSPFIPAPKFPLIPIAPFTTCNGAN